MTANALLNQLGGIRTPGNAPGARRAGAGEGRFDGFETALRQAAGVHAGAADAPQAHGSPAAAQAPRGPANDTGDTASDNEHDDDAPLDGHSVPLTIDGLNALLLTGGTTRPNAGNVARGELQTAAPASGWESAQGGPSAAPSDPGRRGTATSGQGTEAAEAREEGPAASARDLAGASRQTSNSASGRGSSGDADSRNHNTAERDAPNDGARPAPAAKADTADFMRTLALRGAASPAMSSARGVERAGSSAGNSPVVVRSVGASSANTAPSARAARPGDSAATSAAARKEAFAAQMSRVLTTAAAKGGGTMTMRLAPENLGAMTVRMGVEGGVVSASFEASTAAARDLLDSTLSALRTSLEAKGLSVERLHVELAAPTPPHAPEDQGEGGMIGGEPHGEGGGGGSADGRAGESGVRDGARGSAEAQAAAVTGEGAGAHAGTNHQGEVMYLGLDAVA